MRYRSFSIVVSCSDEACLVAVPAGAVCDFAAGFSGCEGCADACGGGVTVVCDCCGCDLGGCLGPNFCSSGCMRIKTTNVRRNAKRSRRSMPGSCCCGFCC